MNIITDILNENNVNIKYVSDKVFEEELAKNSSSSEVLPGFIDQFSLKMDNNNCSKINFSNELTNQVLSNLDFSWPTITKDYLKHVIRRI